MEADWKVDGEHGGKTQEVWCGAGLEDYFSGYRSNWSCPMRTPYVSLEYDINRHSWIMAHAATDEEALGEIIPWLKANLPSTRFFVYWGNETVQLDFVSEKEAIIFRLVWN